MNFSEGRQGGAAAPPAPPKSATAGKWGNLTPLKKTDEKLESENIQKRAVFYVYVIF